MFDLVVAFAATRRVPVAVAPGAPLASVADDVDPLTAVWEALRRAGIAEPGFAFAGWSTTGGLSGPLLPILANCPDVGSLLERLQRFHPLFGRNRVVLDAGPRQVSFGLEAVGGGPADRDTVDACFALLRRAVQQLTNGAAQPDRVRLRRRAPADPSTHHRWLGDVRFGSRHDRCEFDPATLRAPIDRADPVILSMLEPYAERLVAGRDEPWSVTVAAHVGARLADRPTIASVARELALSVRALQLRLQDEGTTFREVVDGVQRERALASLTADDAPLSVIAHQVGFATPAGFSRAVRRWTGRTPTEVRAGR